MSQIKLLGKTNIQGKTIFATDITPTYTITRSASSVDEGSSVTFTLSTTNVANGTVLPYTISGISANDVTSGSLTGNFTVNNGSATTTITMSADQLTEGAETATLTLNNGAASNFVVVNDTSVFTPATISGLQLWLDATTGVYNATSGGSLVTTDGAAIARWQDRSANAFHVTQGTANNQPVLRTAALNGKNIISFDGSNDGFTRGNYNFLRNVPGFTVFAVKKVRSNPGSNGEIVITTSPEKFRLESITTQRTRLKGRRLTTDSLVDLNSANNTSTTNVWESHSAVVNHTSTSATLYKNGSQLVTSSSFGTSGNSADIQVQIVVGYANGSYNQSDVDIAEIIVYGSALSNTDRQAVESYLNTKWALY